MSFLDKLKFWKKDEKEFSAPKFDKLPGEGTADDLGLGEQPGGPKMPTFEEPETAPPPHMRDYQPQPQMQQQQQSPQLEVISNKLDAIKAILSALEQRIANLERMAGNNESQKKYW